MSSEPAHHHPLPALTRLRSLLFARPALWSRAESGLKSAAAFGIPAALAVAAGHPHEALFATFGAFAVLYGDGRPIRVRTSLVAIAGAALLLATWLGAATGHAVLGRAHAPLVMAALLTAVAALAAWVVTALRSGPPGALFFVLVCSAALAAAHGGAPVGRIVEFACYGVVSALAVTAASVLADRLRGAGWERPAVPSVAYRLRRGLSPHSHALTTTARVVTACGVAGGIGVAIGSLRPYWAIIAAVVILANGPDRVRGHARAIHRFAGTAVGLVLFAGLYALNPSGYMLVALLAALMFAIELFIVGNYAVAVLFITPTALLTGGAGAAHGSTALMMRDRFIETIIGVTVAAVCLNIVARRAHRRGLWWTAERVRATAARLESAGADSARDLADSLNFELTGHLNAGMDCAHNDSAWVRDHWDEHMALVGRGRDLVAATATR
ncbi:FUSC family protein [Nocardia yunnanensis]|uniref:FUSC family protein n=1 Tax=Nocardia yunnanensis TaxID=2382165 RepID=UPI0013C52B0B|nr:FUSC family protein [Nocardia yunnanensis]